MSSFITEISHDLPEVLVVGDHSSLEQEVVNALKKRGFQVTVIGVSEVGERLANPLQHSWHKIILVQEAFFVPVRSISTVFSILATRRESIVCIGGGVSELLGDRTRFPSPLTQAWLTQNEFFTQLHRVCPQATLIVGFDLYTTPGLQKLLADINSISLINHLVVQLVLRPQTAVSFGQEAVQIAVKPNRAGTHLIAGEVAEWPATTTKSSVKDLRLKLAPFFSAHLLHQNQAEINSIDFRRLTAPRTKPMPLIQPAPPAPKVVVHSPIPQPFVVESIAPTPPRPSPKIMVSRPPMINNRLKKYETHMAKVRRQQQVMEYLPKQPRAVQSPTGSLGVKTATQEPAQKLIEETLHQVVQTQRGVTTKVRRVKEIEKTIVIQKKEKRGSRVFTGLVAGGTTLVFFGCLLLIFLVTKLKLTSVLFAAADVISSDEAAPTQQVKTLSWLNSALAFQVHTYRLILGGGSLVEANSLVTTAQLVLDDWGLAEQERALQNQVIATVLGKQTGDTFEIITALASKTRERYQKRSLLQTVIQEPQSIVWPQKNTSNASTMTSQLQDWRKNATIASQFETILPEILGQHGKKTYLVVLQSNQELRPIGGTIQSYALLTFNQGALINSEVFDAPSLDTLISGQIAPPEELRTITGQSQWLFRDAMWLPEFSDSAKQAAWFVEHGLGKKVDGVLAINFLTLQQLLAVTGPITISEYNETVSDKNFLEKAEFHSELKLVSNARPDFVTLVLRQMVAQLSTPNKADETLRASGVVFQALKNAQAMLFLTDASNQAIVSSLGWGGEVATPNCPAPFADGTCVVDTIMQVESNVGINKANAYVQRSASHQVVLSASTVTHTRTIVFQNQATSNAWPAGAYKDYLRFYVPTTATLKMFQIDNTPLPATAIRTKFESGKKMFGAVVEVPIQKSVTVKIEYSEPLNLKAPFSYVFFQQKQAGIAAAPTEIRFLIDSGLRPSLVAPQAEVSHQTILFQDPGEKHAFVGVRLN